MSAVDVRCGVAPWLRAAMELGVEHAVGLDGDYVDQKHLLVDQKYFRSCDLETENLRQALGNDMLFDLALCMEVAEHLSSERASSFVTDLCGLSNVILFSAVVPGQGGTNHLNEQWPGYWATMFADNGYVCFDMLRPRLWDREECDWWYLQNVLLFVRQDSKRLKSIMRKVNPIVSLPMSLVHPRALPHTISYASERIAEQLSQYQPFGREVNTRLLEEKVDKLREIIVYKNTEINSLQITLIQFSTDLNCVRIQQASLRHDLDSLLCKYLAIRSSTSW